MLSQILALSFKSLAILARLANLLLLIERLWVARVFFQSGLVKTSDWGNTLYLFTHEYSVPLLPPAWAACSATVFELACPVLLVCGLGARLATVPLLVMTMVIEFTYTDNPEHFIWIMVLGTILCFGPGVVSADYFIRRKLQALQGEDSL